MYLFLFINPISILLLISGITLTVAGITSTLVNTHTLKKVNKNHLFKKGLLVLLILFIFRLIIDAPMIASDLKLNICNEYPSHWNFEKTKVKRCECLGTTISDDYRIFKFDDDDNDICFGLITKSYYVKRF